jgi:alkyl hydroperoxide reductase subunit AhpC
MFFIRAGVVRHAVAHDELVSVNVTEIVRVLTALQHSDQFGSMVSYISLFVVL